MRKIRNFLKLVISFIFFSNYRMFSRMKQINKLRATLICKEYVNGECSTNPTDIIHLFLKNVPSIIEKPTCKHKGCTSNCTEFILPMITLKETEFDGNMENLEKALIEHFPIENLCRKCRRLCHTFERTCGDHIFIEVTLQTTI